MVSWFGPQNHAGYGLLVALQNRQEDEDSVGHESRSSGLLCVEASRARVSQPSLKTGEGVARIMHVASSQRWHRGQVEHERVDATGCVRPWYPYFTDFIVLDPRGILVFFVFYLAL
jgi:hypothetical protein